MFDKYGEPGSYALVTGGSDGIGLEMCHQLAAQGFNILMVARNEEKMQAKIDEIKKAFPSVECKYIVCDFAKYTKMSEYREIFGPQLENLDIGVGIANAGYTRAYLFEDHKDDFMETIMNVNALHVYYLMKILSEIMLKRSKRSALIVTSSMAGLFPFASVITYSAQKSFVTFLTRGMALEMGKKIDVLSFNPAEVATKLIKKDES